MGLLETGSPRGCVLLHRAWLNVQSGHGKFPWNGGECKVTPACLGTRAVLHWDGAH